MTNSINNTAIEINQLHTDIKNTLVSIKDKLIEMGGKEYTEHNCNRVYLSQALFNAITGFGYRLNETKHKFYYDENKDSIYRKTQAKPGKTKIYHEIDGENLNLNK